MSSLTDEEVWVCEKCGCTATSRWDDKLGKRVDRKVEGECI